MNKIRIGLILVGLGANCLAEEPGAGVIDSASSAAASQDQLAQALARAVPHLPAGGFVAAEVRDGMVHYFNVGRPAPMDGIPPERVIFEIGSITKVFTGLLLGQAVVEHKVALTDPISRYLPTSLAMVPALGAVTLEQLATHTAGFPREAPNLHAKNRYDPFADYSVDDLYAYLRGYQPSGAAPRPAAYSNLGTGLLGYILAVAYHESYAQLVAEKITHPLHMPDTVTQLSDEQQSRLAVPHAGALPVRPLQYQDALVGAGGLYSTAADLVRLAQVLLENFDHPLRAAWELARQPRADFPAYFGQIGLGVLLMDRGDAVTYWHGGTTAGTRSHFEWSPRNKHVLVVLMNSDSIEAMNAVVSLYQLVPANRSGGPAGTQPAPPAR